MKKQYFAMALLVSMPALLIYILSGYGFEVADSGWAAVIARDFYRSPEIVGNASPYYLNGLVGALLTNGEIFHADTLRVAGFLPLLCSALTTFCCFFILGYRCWSIAICIFAAGLISYGAFGLYFINYNTISAFFSVLSIAILLVMEKAKFEAYRWLAYLSSGIFLSLAIATRLPTITIILCCFFIIAWKHKFTIRPYALFALGVFMGLAAITAASYQLGQFPYLSKNIYNFFVSAFLTGENGSHTKSFVLTNYYQTLKNSAFYGALLYITISFSTKKLVLRQYFQMLVGLSALAYLLLKPEIKLALNLPVVFILLLATNIIKHRKYANLEFALVGTILCLLFPLGSGNGFQNSIFALWFLLPGVMLLMEGQDKLTAYVILILASCSALYGAIYKPYWDLPPTSLKCKIENSYLRNVSTSCPRAEVVMDIVNFINTNTRKDDEIFIYQNSPMLYVLTNTKPWIPYPWPYINSASQISNSIKEHERFSLPRLIIRDRYSTFGSSWPSETQEVDENNSGLKAHSPIYNDFIIRNQYKLIYENSMYQVLSR